jgi:hypothetical protein
MNTARVETLQRLLPAPDQVRRLGGAWPAPDRTLVDQIQALRTAGMTPHAILTAVVPTPEELPVHGLLSSAVRRHYCTRIEQALRRHLLEHGTQSVIGYAQVVEAQLDQIARHAPRPQGVASALRWTWVWLTEGFT